MARRSIQMQADVSVIRPGKRKVADRSREAYRKMYADMSWLVLQSEASMRGLLRRGMGRDEIEAALLADDLGGNDE